MLQENLGKLKEILGFAAFIIGIYLWVGLLYIYIHTVVVVCKLVLTHMLSSLRLKAPLTKRVTAASSGRQPAKLSLVRHASACRIPSRHRLLTLLALPQIQKTQTAEPIRVILWFNMIYFFGGKNRSEKERKGSPIDPVHGKGNHHHGWRKRRWLSLIVRLEVALVKDLTSTPFVFWEARIEMKSKKSIEKDPLTNRFMRKRTIIVVEEKREW